MCLSMLKRIVPLVRIHVFCFFSPPCQSFSLRRPCVWWRLGRRSELPPRAGKWVGRILKAVPAPLRRRSCWFGSVAQLLYHQTDAPPLLSKSHNGAAAAYQTTKVKKKKKSNFYSFPCVLGGVIVAPIILGMSFPSFRTVAIRYCFFSILL